MLDLETMGQGHNAAIIAIGAISFDLETLTTGQKFYAVIDLQSSVVYGANMDASTVLWWMRQSTEARAVFDAPGLHITAALNRFSDWIDEISSPDTVKIWGNGSDFDNIILASAYRNTHGQTPWKYDNNRCYRTVKALHPELKMHRTGTHQNALDDATSQAEHLIQLFSHMRVTQAVESKA